MRTLITLTLLTFAFLQTATRVPDGSGLEITQFSYKTKLIKHERLVSQVVSMQPPVLDSRSIKLPSRSSDEKNNPLLTVQRDTAQRKSDMNSLSIRAGRSVPEMLVSVFEFQTQIKNSRSQPMTSFVWAYRSFANPPDFVDQQYLCNVRIEPGETKPVKLISPIPQRLVVNASGSGTPPAPLKPAQPDLIINQVQFADGTKWERSDWYGTILLTRTAARKLKSGKCIAL
jgi:hypothetical protein